MKITKISKGTIQDEGINRQVHQLAYTYLPGKIFANAPKIPGKKTSTVSAKIVYPPLNYPLSINERLEIEVGNQIREHLSFSQKQTKLAFYHLESDIQPKLEFFPQVLEITTNANEKIIYWVDKNNTEYSGDIENLQKKLSGKRVKGIYSTDLVFCDNKNENHRDYPIYPPAIPKFADPKKSITIVGDDNWARRKLKISLSNGKTVEVAPRAIYPEKYADYLKNETRRGWYSTPKKARGRDTYIPKNFYEVFYDIISLKQKSNPIYILQWLKQVYPEAVGAISKLSADKEGLERILGLISNLAEENAMKSPMQVSLLKTLLENLNIHEDLKEVQIKTKKFRENIEFLRLMSISEGIELLTPKAIDENASLPSWISDIDENVAKSVSKKLKEKGIENIGPSKKIAIINFVYGWLSGSYDENNYLYKIPIQQTRLAEWPVLYYEFKSEGVLINFEIEKLEKALSEIEGDAQVNKRIFLHSVAHLMLKSLPLYCGIEANLLGERVYYAGKMASIMIFSKEPGEVKLGGIEDTLKRHLPDWLSSWDSLLNCPLESGDEDGCHYCCFIPAGCSDFNKNLSRNLAKKVFEKIK